MANLQPSEVDPVGRNGSPDENTASFESRSLFNLISGDVYDGLRRSFLASGKGRRPDPPVVPFTNCLLLMLHCLRLEGCKTMKEMASWFEKLTGCDASTRDRLDKRVQRTVAKTLSLIGTPLLSDFIHEPLRNGFISAALDAVGVNKDNVLDPQKWTHTVGNILNETVIDLELFRSKERLGRSFVVEWVLRLLGHNLDEISKDLISLCQKSVEKLVTTYKTILKKRGTKEEKLTPFFNEQFIINLNVDSCASSILKPQCYGCSDYNKKLSQLKKENSLLRQNICTTEEKFNEASVKLDCASERYENLQKLYCDVKRKLDESVAYIVGLKKNLSDINLLKQKTKALRLSLKRSFKVNANCKQQLLKEQKKISKCKQQIVKLKNQKKKKEVQEKIFFENDLGCEGHEIKLKGNQKNVYVDKLRTTIMALVCEAGVAAANVSKVISIVSKGIFDYVFKEPLPSKQTVLNICDEGHVLSNIQVVEHLMESSDVTLHSDGTSRDQKKVVGYQFTLASGEQFYLGYVPVASEDSNTLLDVTLNLLQKLSLCYGAVTSESTEIVFKKILSKISSIMTDRAATMKLFDKKLLSYLQSEIGSHVHVHFLHCNAHFLLGMVNACEKALGTHEKDVIKTTGERLGRDKDSKFFHFQTSESATSRVIRTVCDILGPRGDQKNGCRTDWTTFCQNSLIPSFKSNRFNCFFQSATAIIFHSDVLIRFFTCGILPDNPNLKIQSVTQDIQDDVLMSFVCVVALFYLKITGPYWSLVLDSNVKYVEFHKYVKMLVFYLEKWTHDPSELFLDNFESVFGPSIHFKSVTFTEVHKFVNKSDMSVLKGIAMSMSKDALDVTKRQLGDFLDDGAFACESDPETAAILRHCPLTNLIGESAFGDLDFDFSKRRNASYFNRSAVHSVKRNRTVAFLENKSPADQEKLFSAARRLGPAQRLESRQHEKNVQDSIREKFVKNQDKKIQRQLMAIERNSKILEKVKLHNGPCNSPFEVDELHERLLSSHASHKEIEEAFKNEIRLINATTGKRSLKFGQVEDMLTLLKDYLKQRSAVQKD